MIFQGSFFVQSVAWIDKHTLSIPYGYPLHSLWIPYAHGMRYVCSEHAGSIASTRYSAPYSTSRKEEELTTSRGAPCAVGGSSGRYIKARCKPVDGSLEFSMPSCLITDEAFPAFRERKSQKKNQKFFPLQNFLRTDIYHQRPQRDAPPTPSAPPV